MKNYPTTTEELSLLEKLIDEKEDDPKREIKKLKRIKTRLIKIAQKVGVTT